VSHLPIVTGNENERMAIDFQPFDKHKDVRKYWRDLPHWRQEGATYFVTFRLWDSLPQHAVAQLAVLRGVLSRRQEGDESWLHADREIYRMLKRFLDAGHGACFLRHGQAKTVVQATLAFFDGKRYQLGETAVLPNHVHAAVRPLNGCELEDILHSWKTFAAHEINRIMERRGRVWQKEAYDRIVRDSQELQRVERYIRRNRGEVE
jgi:REP element-mobilizing transposase RayT